ncbi:MAG TPA: ATP-binding cassette domain-containing protein [Candidatus Eisenbacteria bacterium]|jgi:ABC-2 type transport system ATP-binding protein
MIELRSLEKSYGETRALKGVSFSISKGEILGLLGPNGAGKTTAMKIVVGYLLPTAGSATVAGYDVVSHPLEVQKRIGYLPENAPLYLDMLAQDYLDFMADMRGLDAATRRRRLQQVVEECGIQSVLTRPIGQLSKGYRQRVGLAAAILHDPEILILDEPTTGLDPNQIVEVRQLIRRMGSTKTVILSTHILPEVEATCDRVVILIDGRVRADAALGQITRSRVQVATLATRDPATAREAFARLSGVSDVESTDCGDGFHTFRLLLSGDAEIGEAVADLTRERGWRLRELKRDDRSLEHVFRELTESAAEAAA